MTVTYSFVSAVSFIYKKNKESTFSSASLWARKQQQQHQQQQQAW